MEAYAFPKDAWHDLLPLRQKISGLATRWRAGKADCSTGETSATLQTSLILDNVASGSFQGRGLLGIREQYWDILGSQTWKACRSMTCNLT